MREEKKTQTTFNHSGRSMRAAIRITRKTRTSKCDQFKWMGHVRTFVCPQRKKSSRTIATIFILSISLIFGGVFFRVAQADECGLLTQIYDLSFIYFCRLFLPVSGMAPVRRFASSPRTFAITFCGEFEPPKKAPPNFENKAESPPLVLSEEATVSPFDERN